MPGSAGRSERRFRGPASAYIKIQVARELIGRLMTRLKRAWEARAVGGRKPLARLTLGARGERLAARHLRRSGYRILARNFRAAGAEVDLVALEGETLVFVEVKTRLGARAGEPQEAVGPRKQGNIRRAAAVFAARIGAESRPIRFDVVAIAGTGRARRVEIVKGAF